MSTFVAQGTATHRAANSWFKRRTPDEQAKARLFCFHHAGAGASAFFGWTAPFSPDIEVVAVQLPGREDRMRDAFMTDIDDVVEALTIAIAPLLDRPFAFYGHSMGASIAYATTAALREKVQPLALFLGAQVSRPALRVTCNWENDQALLEWMRNLGDAPTTLLDYPELFNLYKPILKADLKLADSFFTQVSPRVACPIVAYAGARDPIAQPSHMQEWQAMTTAAFRLHTFDAGHFFVTSQRQALMDSLNSEIRQRLNAI